MVNRVTVISMVPSSSETTRVAPGFMLKVSPSLADGDGPSGCSVIRGAALFRSSAALLAPAMSATTPPTQQSRASTATTATTIRTVLFFFGGAAGCGAPRG